MSSIKFSYLYRDGGNYKNYGEIVFGNPEDIPIEDVENLIRSKLIDGQWFYAREWSIPDLHFDKWDEELDHGFHEVESLDYTEEEENASFSISHFCTLIKQSNWKY